MITANTTTLLFAKSNNNFRKGKIIFKRNNRAFPEEKRI